MIVASVAFAINGLNAISPSTRNPTPRANFLGLLVRRARSAATDAPTTDISGINTKARSGSGPVMAGVSTANSSPVETAIK